MKVLIAVDGSRHAADSLRIAARHARLHGASVSVMNVIPSVADIDLELSASDRDRLLESMRQRGEDILARSRQQLEQEGIAGIDTILAAASSPAAEIISAAERERIDVIVIAHKGRGTGKFHLGSTTDNVVRHAPCSVYVVREPRCS